MKIKITLKDPDGVYESIRDAAVHSLRGNTFVDDKESELAVVARKDRLYEKCQPFIQHGEYVTIEIDTVAGTAVVVPVAQGGG